MGEIVQHGTTQRGLVVVNHAKQIPVGGPFGMRTFQDRPKPMQPPESVWASISEQTDRLPMFARERRQTRLPEAFRREFGRQPTLEFKLRVRLVVGEFGGEPVVRFNRLRVRRS